MSAVSLVVLASCRVALHWQADPEHFITNQLKGHGLICVAGAFTPRAEVTNGRAAMIGTRCCFCDGLTRHKAPS